MNSVFYAVLACAWSGLAAIELREKHYVNGALQIGMAIFDLIFAYLCSK